MIKRSLLGFGIGAAIVASGAGALYLVKKTPSTPSYPCTDIDKAKVNFYNRCRSYIRMEEINSSVRNRYLGDPCTCLASEFLVYQIPTTSDCLFEQSDMLSIFSNEHAKAACIHQK